MIKTRLDPVKEGRLHFLFEYLAQHGPKFNVSISNFVISCLGRIVKEIPDTDKKEKKIFLIYKKIQMESVAKSQMRKNFLMYEEMRKYLVIYEEAVSYI
jgi:hypothetical protein